MKGLPCPKCGYVQKKFSSTCGKCRLPLNPITLKRYLNKIEEWMKKNDIVY